MNWPDPPAAGRLGDGRLASALDRPDDLDALRQAIVSRVDEGLAIYPQGGRTALDSGGVPAKPGAAISTLGLDRVIDYPAADMTITIEAGLTLGDLQTILAENNQRLPLDPPQPDRSTLGGIFATNASGPRRFGAGRPRDLILGVGFVSGAGELIKGGGRVVKNVAGYDFPRLLTGSFGTFGPIVQMTLKVRPRPEASAIAWVAFADPDRAAKALDLLNTSATRPIAIDLFNRPGSRLVGEPLGLPAGDWVLAVGFEDNSASVAWQVDRLRTELADAGSFDVAEGVGALPLWSALTEFQVAEAGPLTLLASLRPSEVVPFARGLDPAHWSVGAHAGSGIVRAHAIGEPTLDDLEEELKRLRAEVAKGRGTLSLPRCPTDGKDRLKIWGDPRDDWPMAERIKRALDPLGVMNPGRFVGTI